MTTRIRFKHLFFSFLVLSQLIVITYLGYQIYTKKKNTLGISVYKLKKEDFLFNPNSNLKYFYEPKPNTIEKVDRWAPSFVIPSIDLSEITYTINSDTLNATTEFSIDKPTNTFRIITLGDSFTFGVYVNTEDNWPEALENSLNNLTCNRIKKFEVINLGVPGYDIQYSVERYKLRGAKYKPDLVLWFLKKDDFTQINELFRGELDDYEKKMNKEIGIASSSSKVTTSIQNSWEDIIDNSTYKKLGEQKTLIIQGKLLEKINDYYLGPLVIFTFPHTEDVFNSVMKKFTDQRNQTYFYDGITHIYNYPELYLPDGHPSKEGHKTIANDLFNYLTKNKIIPCD